MDGESISSRSSLQSLSATEDGDDHQDIVTSKKKNVYKPKRPRSADDEDKDIWASSISLKKIERYFGTVKFCQYPVVLPNDGTVLDTMLNTMRTAFITEGVHYLSLPCLDDFNKLIIEKTPKEIEEPMTLLENVFSTMTRALASLTSTEKEETREEFYTELSSLAEKLRSSSEDTQIFGSHRCNDMLVALKAVCAGQIRHGKSDKNHVNWVYFWNSIFTRVVTESTQGILVMKGQCDETIRVKPSLIKSVKVQSNQGDQRSTSTTTVEPISITCKPDFLLCTEEKEGNLQRRRIAVVGEAKTTKYDGVYSPLSQSESNTEMTPGPSPKKQKLSHASGDAQIDDNKKDRLEDMRTQHFIQLLCMMRRSVHDADDEYTGLGDHMFGCYAVMNKVYITCLVAHTIKKGFASAFTCFEDSADYRAMNAKEHPSLFKQFCFPPLNIFIPEHFKAMLALMKYLVWGRRSLDA